MKQQNSNQLSERAFARLIALSLLSVLLCLVCLCTTTYAWFTGGVTAKNNTLIASTCSLTVSVKEEGEAAATEWSDFAEKEITLSGGKTYEVTLSIPVGSASGYIAFRVGEEVYLSPFVSCKAGAERSATFKIAVNADTVACFTLRWGIYSGEKSVENGGVLTI
ncbi:MAG: hypothetical protein IJX81_06395 [Clostridia bacterium]|nr:hypothetical protein [Clostridia bacterium]